MDTAAFGCELDHDSSIMHSILTKSGLRDTRSTTISHTFGAVKIEPLTVVDLSEPSTANLMVSTPFFDTLSQPITATANH